jgi:hypothetical protein
MHVPVVGSGLYLHGMGGGLTLHGGGLTLHGGGLTLHGGGIKDILGKVSQIFLGKSPKDVRKSLFAKGQRLAKEKLIPNVKKFAMGEIDKLIDAKAPGMFQGVAKSSAAKLADLAEGRAQQKVDAAHDYASDRAEKYGFGATKAPYAYTPKQMKMLRDEGRLDDGKRLILDQRSYSILNNLAVSATKAGKKKKKGKSGRGMIVL